MPTSTIRKALPSTRGEAVDSAQLLDALVGLEKGDFSVRLPSDWTGVAGKVADTFNRVAELNQTLAAELERMRVVVGEQGRLGHRAALAVCPDPGAARWLREPPGRQPHASDHRDRARDRRRGAGRPVSDHGARVRGSPAPGEFLRTARLVNKM